MRHHALLALVLVTLVSLACAPEARAGKMRFGKDETLHELVDIKLKGAKGEALYLGHKTTITWFIAGVWVADDGYILGIKGGGRGYYDMPDAAKVAEFQKAGLLPDPLPPHSIPIFERIFGYSLWIVLAGVGIWTAIENRRNAAIVGVAAVAGGSEPPPPETKA